MDAFGYLTVLVSIILGLGIAQLLGGFGRCIEHRASLRPYTPALLWAGILLLVHVQTWWAMFGLRTLQHWTFLAFAVVLLQPIVLYLLTILVLPSQSGGAVDIRSNFFNQRRWFFGLFVLLLMVSVQKDVVISGSLPDATNLLFHAAFLVLSLIALATDREFHHLLLAVISAFMMLVYVVLLFAVLQ